MKQMSNMIYHFEGGINMAEDPKIYHCNLPADLSVYDHLPYHVNPTVGDGSQVKLWSGNIIRGCPVNYLDKKIISNQENEES